MRWRCPRWYCGIAAGQRAISTSRGGPLAPTMAADQLIVMNLCGRGDKDIFTVAEALGVTL